MCQNKIWVVSSPTGHIVPAPLWNLMSWASTVCITHRTTVFSGSYQNGPLSYIPPPFFFVQGSKVFCFSQKKKYSRDLYSTQHHISGTSFCMSYFSTDTVSLLKSIWMTQRRASVMTAKTWQGSKSKSWLWQFHQHRESRVSMVMG